MKLIPLQETIWVGYGECRGPLGVENDNPSDGEKASIHGIVKLLDEERR